MANNLVPVMSGFSMFIVVYFKEKRVILKGKQSESLSPKGGVL